MKRQEKGWGMCWAQCRRYNQENIWAYLRWLEDKKKRFKLRSPFNFLHHTLSTLRQKVKNAAQAQHNHGGSQRRRRSHFQFRSYQAPMARVLKLQRRRHALPLHRQTLQLAPQQRHPSFSRRRWVRPRGRHRADSTRRDRGVRGLHRRHLPKIRVVEVVPRGAFEDMRV